MTHKLLRTFDPYTLDSSDEWMVFVGTVLSIYVEDYAKHRRGQGIMNALCDVRPDLYRFASGQIWDPFYKDERLHEFWIQIYNRYVETLED